MTEIFEYKLWLASAATDRTVVETISIEHSAMPPLNLARWNFDFTATTEGGQTVTYGAGDFYIEPAPVEANTNQAARGVIAALQGKLYDTLRGLTPTERALPLTVTHRLYFADDPSRPLINPPPSWQVYSVTAGIKEITADLNAMALRDRAVGIFYTIQNFPLLYYV